MLEPPAMEFPEVAMEIWRENDTTTEAEVIQGMGLDDSGDEEAFGMDGDMPIHRYYVTDVINDQVFVVKQIYFLEAAGGGMVQDLVICWKHMRLLSKV